MAEPYNVQFTLSVIADDPRDAARKGKNAMMYATQMAVYQHGKLCGMIDIDGGESGYSNGDGEIRYTS